MTAHEKFMEVLNEMDKLCVDAVKEMYQTVEAKMKFMKDAEKNVEKYRLTGVLPLSAVNNSTENTSPVSSDDVADLESKPSTHSEQSTATRLTRSTARKANTNLPNNVLIKLERITEEFKQREVNKENLTVSDLIIKTEMPPPAKAAPKKKQKKKTALTDVSTNEIQIEVKSEQDTTVKKKSKVSKKTEIKQEASLINDSDIEIQTEAISSISIHDSYEEVKESSPVKHKGKTRTKRRLQNEQESSDDSSVENKNKKLRQETASEILETTVRVTRTKTRLAAKNKELEKDSEDSSPQKTQSVRTTRTKTKKDAAANNQKLNSDSSSVYEDAVSHFEMNRKTQNKTISKDKTDSTSQVPVENNVPQALPNGKVPNLNETVVIQKPNFNQTIVINKPDVVISPPNNNINELMTDDEDVVEDSPLREKGNKTHKVLSPYENSPVKKKIEAFEKLRAAANADVSKTLKTKATVKEDSTSSHLPKPKFFGTPTASNKTSIPHILRSNANTTTTCKNTTRSGQKAAQNEYRERELRRQQKEAEALQKKEALIQLQTEEKRRKREEREQKARQMREAKEKEKQKALEELERAKQEKYKQIMADKQELRQKQTEEIAKKREMAMKKAEERKKYLQQQNGQSDSPPYRHFKAPRLPTAADYDSDEEKPNESFIVPDWAAKQRTKRTLRNIKFVTYYKQGFFINKIKSPDLRDIFPKIDTRKLKRTSSAIWNQTDMSMLENLTEEDEC